MNIMCVFVCVCVCVCVCMGVMLLDVLHEKYCNDKRDKVNIT
jgi:hypothetical protein